MGAAQGQHAHGLVAKAGIAAGDQDGFSRQVDTRGNFFRGRAAGEG